MSPRVVHVVKWYPNPNDPQNGVFVKKHIDALGDDAPVIGFIDGKFATLKDNQRTIYGSSEMTLATKVRLFYGFLGQFQPDIVHFHCFTKDLWLLHRIAKSKGISCVHTEHWSGFLPSQIKHLQPLDRFFAKSYFNALDLILPVSGILAEGIKQIAPKAKTEIVPNIVEAIKFQSVQKNDCTKFCVVGDVVFAVKRQDAILRSFLALPQAQSELHFYGGGPDMDELRNMCAPYSNVFVHGRATNQVILSALPTYDIHVQFSTYETFGIATLEARRAGLWCISRKEFGSSDYADQGIHFAENEQELVENMRKLLDQEKPGPAHWPSLETAGVKSSIQKCYLKLK